MKKFFKQMSESVIKFLINLSWQVLICFIFVGLLAALLMWITGGN